MVTRRLFCAVAMVFTLPVRGQMRATFPRIGYMALPTLTEGQLKVETAFSVNFDKPSSACLRSRTAQFNELSSA